MLYGQFTTEINKLLEAEGLEIPRYEELLKRVEDGEAAPWNLDKDVFRTPNEVVEAHGLTLEYHKVHTEDRYINTHWRVFNSSHVNRKPIILQHGLLDDAFTWLTPTWKYTLVKLLTDVGYEVWLTNSRGNRYSYEHEVYTTRDKEYWAFSFHEMGVYD